MSTRRTITAVSALTITAALAIGATAAAAPSNPSAPAQLATPSAPLLSQEAQGYRGAWTITGGSLQESFTQGGVEVSTGTTSLREGLAPDQVISFGYVAGFGDPVTGESYAQLSSQAGPDVTAVRVISASGITAEASLADGVWGAVWVAGDHAEEYGNARIEIDTPTGTTATTTNDVDVIAADQRADEDN